MRQPGSSREWPDTEYEGIAQRVGRACFGMLFSERRWIHRRVETISLLSPEMVRRSVSVDFTVPRVFRDRIALPSHREWLVPLATLRKAPLRHFDLSDEAGRAVPLVGRSQNKLFSHAALVASAGLALKRAKEGAPSDELIERLRIIAAESPAEAEDALGQMLDVAGEGDAQHQTVLGDAKTTSLMLDLAESYVLLAVVDDVDRRRVLKFSYDYELENIARPTIPAQLGWAPLWIETEVPASIRTHSYHAEIEIPEELRIDGSVIYDEFTFQIYGKDGRADRAAVYVPAVPPDASPVLLFSLRGQRSSAGVSFGVSLITAAVLVLGAIVGGLQTSLAGPPITLLLAGSALFTGAVARSGEHPLVKTLLVAPRLLLFLSAVSALAAASVLAFGFCDYVVSVTWWICAGVAFTVAVILAVTFARSAPTTPKG